MRVARWLESVHVARGVRLENEDLSKAFAVLSFKDEGGSVHVVHVNPDGSVREYRDPSGKVHRYKVIDLTPPIPAPAQASVPHTTMAPPSAAAMPAAGPRPPMDREVRSRGRPETRAAPAVAAPVQPSVARPPNHVPGAAPDLQSVPRVDRPERLDAAETRPVVPSPSPPAQAVAGTPEPAMAPPGPGAGQRRSMEEGVIEWLASARSLTGMTIVRREIGSKGIVFKVRGRDGSEYEVMMGMDQQVKGFRKV